jgi:hypothetical protein
MWNPTTCSPSLEIKREGRKLVHIGSSFGTVAALPAVSHSVRYFEVEIVRNKGAVYIGWMEDSLVKAFDWQKASGHAYVGWKAGSVGINSQSGCIGTGNVWKSYFGRKIRNGDVVGSLLDLNKGEVRFLLRSPEARNLRDVFPSFGLPVDPHKVYHACTTLKHTQTKVYATFTHPFALWDMITTEFGKTDLFSLPPSLPFRIVSPVYNKALPLPLSAASHHQTNQALQLATENFNSNCNHLGLLSLPFELLIRIFTFLDVNDIPLASPSCHAFYEASMDHRVWNSFVQRDYHFGLDEITQHYFGNLTQSEKKLTDSDALEAMYRDPYRHGFETVSQAAKERYRMRYHWHKGRYDLLPSFPTENNVKAITYDEERRILFYSESERFYSYSFSTGDISLGLFSTVGEILRMKYMAPGLLFLLTDLGFLHIIETVEGSQLSRISQTSSTSFDVHIDQATDTTLIVFGTKNHAVIVWKINGLVRRSQHIINLPRNRHLKLGPSGFGMDSELDRNENFGFESEDEETTAASSIKNESLESSEEDEESEDDGEESEEEDVLIRVGTPTIVWENLSAHKKKIVDVSFLPHSKGTQILSASPDGEVLFWRLVQSLPRSASSTPKSNYNADGRISADLEGLDDDEDENSEASSMSSEGPRRDPNDPIDVPIKEIHGSQFDFGARPWARWKMVSLESPLSELVCMTLSPEGLFGAVASSGGEIMLFDAKDGTTGTGLLPVTNFELHFKNRTHNTAVVHIHYECGGKLITTHDDNTVRSWDQKTGQHTWSYQMALPPSSLFGHDNFLSFGTIHGRLFTMDFSEVDIPEERASFALSQKRAYLETLSQLPMQESARM